jgi:hypothetical protein
MTLTQMPPNAVTGHWGTPMIIGDIPLDGLLRDSIDQIGIDGEPFEAIPAGHVVADGAALKAAIQASLNALAIEQGAPPVTDATIEVQVWRHGYDEPAAGHPAEFVAWCYLSASAAPAHTESGALSFADPRAGSAMTAMPGLPWGRQVMIRPVPGAHAAAPGWLTTSVVPLERGQYAVVAIATSVR